MRPQTNPGNCTDLSSNRKGPRLSSPRSAETQGIERRTAGLAVLDGMVVTVAGETLVVPLNAIVETLSLTETDLRSVGPGQVVLCVREKFVPVLDLGKELGYRDVLSIEKGAIALLISPEEGKLVAMLVDTIEDQRQVVIKGLQESYGRVRGVAAATILGDGKIALILDAGDIAASASGVKFETLEKEAS